MPGLTTDVPWDSYISSEGKTELGNGANRFDTQRQNDTLGPQPPSADTGPAETNGEPGRPEQAPEPAL